MKVAGGTHRGNNQHTFELAHERESMTVVSQRTVLRDVEYILGSGNGTLDFAIQGEDELYTWHGVEDADWNVEDVERVENVDEDRFAMHPEGEVFVCEIDADDEEFNRGPVRCYCE